MKKFDLWGFGAALVRASDLPDVDGQTFLFGDEPMKAKAKKKAARKAARKSKVVKHGRRVPVVADKRGNVRRIEPPISASYKTSLGTVVHDGGPGGMVEDRRPLPGTNGGRSPLLNFRASPAVVAALKHLAKNAEHYSENSVGAQVNKALRRFLDLAEVKKRLTKPLLDELESYQSKLNHRSHRY
jgi:hypothetical protein